MKSLNNHNTNDGNLLRATLLHTCIHNVGRKIRYECMKHIIDDKADIVNLNNEELYLAGRMYNLEPFALEQYNGGKWPLH